MLFELAYLEEMRAFPLRKVLGMADTASRVLIPSNKVSYLYLSSRGKFPEKPHSLSAIAPFISLAVLGTSPRILAFWLAVNDRMLAAVNERAVTVDRLMLKY
jgi:hypothetical protein